MKAGNGAACAYGREQKRNSQATRKGWLSENLGFPVYICSAFIIEKRAGPLLSPCPFLAAGGGSVCDGAPAAVGAV